MRTLDPHRLTRQVVTDFLLNAHVKISDYDPDLPDYIYNDLKLSTLFKALYLEDFELYFKEAPREYVQTLAERHPNLVSTVDQVEGVSQIKKALEEETNKDFMSLDVSGLIQNLDSWGNDVLINFMELIYSGAYVARRLDNDDGTYYFNIEIKTH